MATTPTNKPIPSEDPRDLKFNAGKIDEVVTGNNHYYTDRFGVRRWTIAGFQYTAEEAIHNYGYITMDSFEDGAALTLPNQVLRYEATGEYYRWDGEFPKTVSSGSAPETAGGIGIGAWVSVGDASLRSELSKNDGYSHVGELQSVVEFFGLIKRDGARVKLRSWYSGWSATSYGKPSGGGEFIYMSGVSKSKHDGCIYFSPTVPYSATLSDYVTGVGESDPTGSGVWVRDISGSTDIHSDWAGIQDGSTANSVAAHATALQSVFNAASSLLKNVKLGRGHIHVDHQVFLNPFHNDNRVLPMVYGCGSAQTFLVCYPLGANIYNISVNRNEFTRSWGFGQFTVMEKDLTQQGYLVHLLKITGAVFDRIRFVGGAQQLLAQSVLSCTWVEPSWSGGIRGARFESGGAVSAGYANPNANKLIRPQILSMVRQGIFVSNATQFQIDGGSMEGCGVLGGESSIGLYVEKGGADGVIGIVVKGMYIEGNLGFPFYIVHGGVDRSINHKIIDCTFNNFKTRYPTSQVIVLGDDADYSASTRMTLEMRGNSCAAYGGYEPSSSRPGVNIVGYKNRDNAVFLNYDNQWVPGQPPDVSQNVKVVPFPGFSFSAGVVGATGALYSRSNIVSAVRKSAGVYTVTVNHDISNVDVNITLLGKPGYAVLASDLSGYSFDVLCYNASGVPTDINFKVTGFDYRNKFTPAYD